MRKGRVIGADEVSVEFWRCLGKDEVWCFIRLFNVIIRIADEWIFSFLIPLFKNNENIRNCNNYRSIRLFSYIIIVWERVVEKRMRKYVVIS